MGHRLSKSSWSSSNKNQNSSKTSSKKNAGNSLSTTATTTINSISHTPTIDLITTTNSQNLQIQSATLTVPNQVVPQSFIIRIQLSKMEPETTATTAGMASGSGIDEQQKNLEAAIAAITTQFENQNFIQTSLDNNLNIDSKQPIINLTFTKNIICDASNSTNNTVDCIQNDSHQSGAINSDNEIKLSNLVPSSSSATASASNSIASSATAMSNRTIDHNLNANFINDFNNILQRDSNGRQEINWSINCNNNNHSLMTTVTNLNTNSNNNCNNNNNNANFNINITNNNLNSGGIENSQISNIINSTSGGTTVCNISTTNLPSNLTTTLNINNRTFNNNNNNNFIATASSNSNSNNSQALMRLNSSSCIEYNDVPDSTPVLSFLAPAVICAEDGKPHRVCHCKRNRSPAYPSKWRCCVCFETLKNLNVAKANKKHWMAKLKCKRPDSTTKEKTPDEDSKSNSTSTSRSSLDSSSQSSGIEAYPPGHVVTPPCIQNHFIQTMTRCNNLTGTPNVIVVSVNHPKPSCCVGAMEDCDDRARRLRALEIAQGVDPPPGFIPQQQQILAPIDPAQLSPNATPAFPQQGLSPEMLGSAIAAIGVPNTWHMLCSQGSGATNMANVSCFGTIVHSQVDYIHCLVPDLEKITSSAFYWGKMDRYEAERLLEGKPEGTFLLRDSAQEEYLFSVTFRKYGRSLHARIEQYNHKFSFDCHDPGVYTASTVTGLLEHYKDPSFVMFFEPMLTIPLNRNFTFSLQQLCRATIVSNIKYDGINELHLPNSLKSYLKEYHYKLRVRVKPFDENFYNGS